MTQEAATIEAHTHVSLLQETLREPADFCGRTRNPTNRARISELIDKLRAQRFNLVVFGEFKRGKTTLINALVGDNLLPSAALPLTSVVTILHYSDERTTQVHFSDGRILEVPPSKFSEFVTEVGNPENHKGVAFAHAGWPADLLRNGRQLVDTPGRGLDLHPQHASCARVHPTGPNLSRCCGDFRTMSRPAALRVSVIRRALRAADDELFGVQLERKALNMTLEELKNKSSQFKRCRDELFQQRQGDVRLIRAEARQLIRGKLQQHFEDELRIRAPELQTAFSRWAEERRDTPPVELLEEVNGFIHTTLRDVITRWRAAEEARLNKDLLRLAPGELHQWEQPQERSTTAVWAANLLDHIREAVDGIHPDKMDKYGAVSGKPREELADLHTLLSELIASSRKALTQHRQ